jgi:phosphoenolpyruvate---glycerone phosphotransferase subunit DhaL
MSAGYEQVMDWVRRFAADVAERKDELTKLDQAIGDGDHGSNMDRGLRKAVEKLDTVDGDDIGAALKAVGMALVSSVGGAGGPLYGTFFLQAGQSTAGRSELDTEGFAAAVRAGVEGVQSRGKAQPDDKTMVDALLPAVAALEQGGGIGEAASRAADAAEDGMRATIPLIALKGRASYLGERSRGHQDPGATSSALMMRAAAEAFAGSS